MAEASQKLNLIVEDEATSSLNSIAKAFKGVINTVSRMKRNYDALGVAMETAGDYAVDFKGQVGEGRYLASMAKSIQEAEEELENLHEALARAPAGINKWENIPRKIKKMERAISQMNEELDENKKRFSKTANVVMKTIMVYRKSKKQYDKLRLTLQMLSKDHKLVGKHLLKTTKSAIKQRMTMANLTKVAKMTAVAYFELGRGALYAGKKIGSMGISAAARGLSLLGQKLLGISEGFGRLGKSGIANLGQAISDVTRGILEKGISGLKNLAVESMRTFSSYELSMKKIRQFGGFAKDEMKGVEATMRTMIKTTLFSAEELQVAFEELAAVGEFGGNTEQFNTMAKVMTEMATATGETDLERTGQILMSTTNAFRSDINAAVAELVDMGMSETEAFNQVIEGVGDVLVKVANESALSVSQIGTAMQYVNQTAASAGMSLNDTAAAIGFLSNMGFEASRAGTALNQAMKSMVDPSKEAESIMNDLGISFFDSQGNMKSMVDIAKMLNSTFESAGMTVEEQLGVMADLFGVRGARAIQAMMNETEALEEMFVSMGDASGATARGMEEMMNSVAGQTAVLQGSLEDIKITIAEAFDQSFREALTLLNEFLASEEAQAFFEELGGAIAEFIDEMLPVISDILPSLIVIIQAALPIIKLMADFFVMLLSPLRDGETVNKFAGFIMKLVNILGSLLVPIMNVLFTAFDIMEEPMNIMIDIIANVIIPIVIMFFDLFMSNAPMLKILITQIMVVIKALSYMILGLMKVLMPLINMILQFAGVILMYLLNVVIELMPTLSLFIQVLIILGSVFISLSPILKGLGWIITNMITPAITGFIWLVNTALQKVLDGIRDFIAVLADMAEAAGLDDVAESMNNVVEAMDDASASAEELRSSLQDMDSQEISFDVDTSEFDKINNENGIPYSPDNEPIEQELKLTSVDGGVYPVEDGELQVNVNAKDMCDNVKEGFQVSGSSIADILSENAEKSVQSQVYGVPTQNSNTQVNNNSTYYIDINIDRSDLSDDTDPDEFAEKLGSQLARRIT